MDFLNNLSREIPATMLASKDGLSYLSASAAMSLADLPAFEFVDFEVPAVGRSLPYLPCFGGGLVAVDIRKDDVTRRMWLPMMTRDNDALPLKAASMRDVNSNRQRALVKAIAATTGVGMSVFMGHEGDGVKSARLLNVTADTDLRTVTPVVASFTESEVPYVEWTVGLAAAMISDPLFNWSVQMFNGLPYMEVLGGAQVVVTTSYKGTQRSMPLPIMDGAHEPLPLEKINVLHWNKTMMRALTKGIAFHTGYGLSVYAEESEERKATTARSTSRARGSKTSTPASRPAEPAKSEAPTTDVLWLPAVGDLLDAVASVVQEGNLSALDSVTLPVYQLLRAGTAPDAPAAPWAEPVQGLLDDALAVRDGQKNVEGIATHVPAVRALYEAHSVAMAEGAVPKGVTGAATAESATTPKDTPKADPVASEPVKTSTAEAAPMKEPKPEKATEPEKATASETEKGDAVASAPVESPELTRFKAVMTNRHQLAGVDGLLGLFEALKVSTKFAEADKPVCFAELIVSIAKRMKTPEHALALVQNIGSYSVAGYVTDDADRKTVVGRVLLKAMPQILDQGSDAVMKLVSSLVDCGIAQDAMEVLEVGQDAELPKESLDLLSLIVEDQAAG